MGAAAQHSMLPSVIHTRHSARHSVALLCCVRSRLNGYASQLAAGLQPEHRRRPPAVSSALLGGGPQPR